MSSTKELFEWSLKEGVRLRGLTTRNFSTTGRGMMTTRYINTNDVLLSVPKSFLITFDTVLRAFKWISREPSFCLTPKDLFLLFLIVEKRKKTKSAFAIYLKSVPKEYTTPCCISPLHKDVLPYFAVEEMEKQNCILQEHFQRLNKTIKCHKERFSMFVQKTLELNEVKWSWNVVNTRSVYFNSRDLSCSHDAFPNLKEIDFALAPLLDMLNHNSKARVDAKFDPSIGCYEIRTLDSYNPKQEVFINYGCHGNRTLYFEYGFILPNNIHAMCPIDKKVFLKHFPFCDVDEENLLKKGISLDSMVCMPDGTFDWSFITASHLLIVRDKQNIQEKCTQQICLIYQRTLDLLNELLFDYSSYILNLSSHQSAPLDQLKSLIQSEYDILKITKQNWKSLCQMT